MGGVLGEDAIELSAGATNCTQNCQGAEPDPRLAARSAAAHEPDSDRRLTLPAFNSRNNKSGAFALDDAKAPPL